MDPRLTSYPARSGYLVPWQAEILAAWRYERAYWSAQADRLIRAGVNGIDPTVPIKHTSSFSVYEP